MVKNDFRMFARHYDHIYLARKDYERESQVVRRIIRQYEERPSKTLLDVGCGTGEHLKYLSRSFRCKGIDISKEMIDMAKVKVPHAEFQIADMIDFKLEEKFDVITCLFGSIGYVQTFENLAITLENFRDHLKNKGLALVEPWVFRRDFQKGKIAIDTYEDDKIRLVRMGTSKLTRTQWLIYFHYLIGADGEIKHVHEVHKMLAADYEDYLRAFNLARYGETRFLKEDQWTGSRGLFIATNDQ